MRAKKAWGKEEWRGAWGPEYTGHCRTSWGFGLEWERTKSRFAAGRWYSEFCKGGSRSLPFEEVGAWQMKSILALSGCAGLREEISFARGILIGLSSHVGSHCFVLSCLFFWPFGDSRWNKDWICREVETEELLWVWGQPRLHGEFKVNLGYTVSTCLMPMSNLTLTLLQKYFSPNILYKWPYHRHPFKLFWPS